MRARAYAYIVYIKRSVPAGGYCACVCAALHVPGCLPGLSRRPGLLQVVGFLSVCRVILHVMQHCACYALFYVSV